MLGCWERGMRVLGLSGMEITPPLYHDYLDLKKKHGPEAANQVIQFRLLHLDELSSVAEEKGLTEESQCRKYDVFFGKDMSDGAKEKLGRYLEELPSEKGGWGSSRRRAAVHLYRLVTGIPSRLLKTYSSFRLYTHTPCLSILNNIVLTPNTSPTLLTDGRRANDGWLGTRSFVLFPGVSMEQWDYLTQQPPNPAILGERPHAEFMSGGGIEIGTPSFFDTVGCADDSEVEFQALTDLGGALVAYFGKWWGDEWADKEDDHFERGRVKKAWSGVLGTSADGLPWVGSVPSKVSDRSEGREWIAAGYLSEGMVHAWMSGKPLAYMLLRKDVD
ncbi:uncharacterized protein ARMOST_06399 [Armillaria ostoyae]|uniref:Uncharacterized protein n=1 Tax=Armillaria ostoyae TaxID=47428 RepID=A0A284R2V8_ARMOS|nr:uncharacterized protein ARMOST_06399 [Armillaria ostoyae]